MNTYIFSSEYEVFCSNASSENEAIEKIEKEISDKYNNYGYEEAFKDALAEIYHKKVVIPEGGAVVISHSNA